MCNSTKSTKSCPYYVCCMHRITNISMVAWYFSIKWDYKTRLNWDMTSWTYSIYYC